MMKRKHWKALAPWMAATVLTAALSGCGGGTAGTETMKAAPGTEATKTEAGGTAEAGSAEKPVVKVGVMCSMSGENARFGEIYKASITAAMKAVNEDGLLKDYSLEFEYIDDKGSTDGAPAAATYALNQYGANVSIGHMLTTMILASAPMFEEAEVPLLGIVSGPASVAQGFQYLCIETGTDLIQADTLLQYLVEEKGFSNIGLIHINTEGGMSAADRIEETLKSKYSLELATRDAMANEDVDFTAQVLKMKDAGVESVIFWGMSQANGNLMMKQIEQTWGPVPEEIFFAGGTNLAQNQMLETWGEEDIAGVVFPVGYIPDESNEAIVRFMKDFTEADPLKQDPADVPARVYDSVFHLVTALNGMGPYDVSADDFGSKLNDALRHASFDGVQGHFDFGAFNDGQGFGQMNIGEWGAGYTQTKVFPK